MRLSPHLPYLYVPDTVYKWFVTKVNKEYKYLEERLTGKPICDEDKNTCNFPVACDKVEYRQIDITLNLRDADGGSYPYEMPFTSLLVSGTEFGDSDDTCYLGVFNSGLSTLYKDDKEEKNVLYVGNIFMQRYYTVFDQTAIAERKYKIQVGLAPRADVNTVGKTHYDYKSPDYAPEPQADDSSSVMVGTPDQYLAKQKEALEL